MNKIEVSQMNRIEVDQRSINVLRIMLSGIFLIAGVNHVAFPGHVAERLMASPVYENMLFFMNAEILVMATGIGLFAAIPAVVAYNRYSYDIDRLANRFETFTDEFSNILHRHAR